MCLGYKVFVKKTFVIYCQTLLKAWTKVGLNFAHFAWAKLTNWSRGFIYAQKAPFSTNQDIFNESFADSFAEFSRIFWSFSILGNILQYLMKLNEIYNNFTFDFVHYCCISLTFPFNDFKKFLQNFSLVWTGSKFVNFGRWKSQYRSYLILLDIAVSLKITQ